MIKPMVPFWVGRYVGIPFADNGHDRNGCNCWGLVRLVLLQEKGIELPSYAEISAADMLKAARAFRDDSQAEPWRAVGRDAVAAFDVALMHAMAEDSRVPGHVGIMVSNSRVLHVWRATDAVHMAIDHPRIQTRVIGFYRHRDLMPKDAAS